MIRVYALIAAVLGLLAVIGWAYIKGGTDTAETRELEDARDYIEQTEEVRNATDDLPDDDDAVLDQLRRYAQ